MSEGSKILKALQISTFQRLEWFQDFKISEDPDPRFQDAQSSKVSTSQILKAPPECTLGPYGIWPEDLERSRATTFTSCSFCSQWLWPHRLGMGIPGGQRRGRVFRAQSGLHRKLDLGPSPCPSEPLLVFMPLGFPVPRKGQRWLGPPGPQVPCSQLLKQ